jgi:hypothetical protein
MSTRLASWRCADDQALGEGCGVFDQASETWLRIFGDAGGRLMPLGVVMD